VYLRRSAIELVGDFDLAFSPGYGEEVDYSQRCLRAGLSHVLADDVLVLHHGGGSFGAALENPHQKRHERLLATRYPYYHQNVVAAAHGVATPLSRALGVARRALEGLSVVIDGRILAGPMTGTQLHVLELIAALARSNQVRVTTIVPDAPGAYAERALSALDRVTVVTRVQLEQRRSRLKEPRADVVHRPFQVSSHEDLAFLSELGERLIVTHQDMISYCNPSYFKDFQAWEGYRRLTREALAVADRVLFFSAFARDDALAEDLVEPSRASVVHIGVDHAFALGDEQPVAPADAGRLPDGAEAILCIGTDFRHKNRTFALRLLDELRRRHDWRGYLLLVGPRVTSGSSIPDERELLADSPGLGDAVLRFGAVSDAEKAWLYGRSRLVVYPTVHEGFGLIPFEAAEHGVPCMWADGTALSEVLPAGQASIVAWNAADSADRALGLLRDDQLRADNLRAIKDAAAKLTWDATAVALVDLYGRTCDAPAAPASGFERSDGLMTGVFSEDAIRLMGPDGALPEDVERPLLALATHRQLGAPMFTAIKLGYRASFRLRRWRRNGGDQDGGG
jgi:glycosyltransferase involved in cell wall biosynthesis